MIKKGIHIIYVFLVSIMIFGCSLSVDEYYKWLINPENGMCKELKSNGYVFEVQYLPEVFLDYQKEKQGMSSHNKDNAETERMHYYKLTLKRELDQDIIKHGNSSKEEQDRRIYFLSYTLKKYIHNEEGKEPSLYHFERSYGAKSLRNFMIGFEAEQAQAESRITEIVILPNEITKDTLRFAFDLSRLPKFNKE